MCIHTEDRQIINLADFIIFVSIADRIKCAALALMQHPISVCSQLSAFNSVSWTQHCLTGCMSLVVSYQHWTIWVCKVISS